MSARLLPRELGTILQRPHTSDFVLELAEGVTEESATLTLRGYVMPARSRSPSPLPVLTSPAERER